MTAHTITFTARLGSDGSEIAQETARLLGYHFFDWEITSRAALAAGVSPATIAESERNRPRVKSIVESLFLSPTVLVDGIDTYAGHEAELVRSPLASLSSVGYRNFVEDVIRELANQGNAVIVGHAAQVILKGEPGVLKVLVGGSVRNRAERLARNTESSLESATRMIAKSDGERRAFFKQVYGVDPWSPQLYDFAINTDRMSAAAAAQCVLVAARSVGDLQRQLSPSEQQSQYWSGPDVVPRTTREDALQRARQALSMTVDEGIASNPDVERVLPSLITLQRVFDIHIRESEAAEGSLNEVLRVKPFLERRVWQIREEHARIRAEMLEFVADLKSLGESELDGESIKDRVARTLTALRLHEGRGADLLHDAYFRDESIGL